MAGNFLSNTVRALLANETQIRPTLQVCSVRQDREHLEAKKKKAATMQSYVKTNQSIIGKRR